MMGSREAFEQWISAPPYERTCERSGPEAAWPGQYLRYETQLAWEAWQARDAEVERLTDADAFSRRELRRGNEIIDGLRAEVEALRQALQDYGNHRSSCANRTIKPPYTHDAPRNPCDCGLDAALAAGRE